MHPTRLANKLGTLGQAARVGGSLGTRNRFQRHIRITPVPGVKAILAQTDLPTRADADTTVVRPRFAEAT